RGMEEGSRSKVEKNGISQAAGETAASPTSADDTAAVQRSWPCRFLRCRCLCQLRHHPGERPQVAQIDDFSRRVAVSKRPGDGDVDPAVARELGAVVAPV